jgi:flagellar basal-body rod protein FlgC
MMGVHGPFAGIDISNTGLGFHKYWMDTIAHNIANVNTFTSPGQDPFRARMVIAMPNATGTYQGGGVHVSAVVNQEGDPPTVYDPEHPLAGVAGEGTVFEEDGYVQGPVVDLGGQLGDLILASRSYQANLTAFREARTSLEAATTIGRV